MDIVGYTKLAKKILLVGLIIIMVWTINGSTRGNGLHYPKATIDDILTAIKEKRYTCSEITTRYLKRIEAYNKRGPKLNAIITVNQNALKEANYQDKIFNENGQLKRLHCVPLVVKDNIDVKDLPTTNGAKALENSIPYTDAFIVKKLREAGCIVLGKSNMALFADDGMDSLSEVGGQCRNPFETNTTCFGSSGGSGAAIAAGLSVLALGTDTEGSIMNPASAGNAFGVRAAHDQISLDGVYPALSKMDVVGPISHWVKDSVKALDVILNEKYENKILNRPNEWKTLNIAVLENFASSWPANLSIEIGGMKLPPYKLSPEIKMLFDRTIKQLRSVGAKITSFKWDFQNKLVVDKIFGTIGGLIQQKSVCSGGCRTAETDQYFSNPDRFPTTKGFKSFSDLANSPKLSKKYREKYQAIVKSTKTGNATNYCESQCRQFSNLQQRFKTLLTKVFQDNNIDVLIYPTEPNPPHKIGETVQVVATENLSPFSTLPSVNLPVGFTMASKQAPRGLPYGVTLLGMNLTPLLQISYEYQKNHGIVTTPAATPEFNKNQLNVPDYPQLSANAIRHLVESKKISCMEITRRYLLRIEEYNDKIGAVVTTNRYAVKVAKQIDNGEYPPLKHRNMSTPLICVPVLVKDNIDVVGMATTNGANALIQQIPTVDAYIVQELKKMGAIIIGKTNMALFADDGLGTVSETGGQCRNPFDLKRTCYGSSGGSGAAIAAGLAVITLGTDTQGSIIAPASGGNSVGVRPGIEMAKLTARGVYPAFQKMDVVGPITHWVQDATYVIDAMFRTNIANNLESVAFNNMKIAVLGEFAESWPAEIKGFPPYNLDDQVKFLFDRAIGYFKESSATVTRLNIGIDNILESSFARALVTLIQQKSVCSTACRKFAVDQYFNNSKSKQDIDSFEKLVRSKKLNRIYQQKYEKILEATQSDGSAQCQENCTEFDSNQKVFRREVERWFGNGRFDVIIYPSLPVLPHNYKSRPSYSDATFISSFSGLPSITVPIGFSMSTKQAPYGLPVGMTMLANGGKENLKLMLSIAHQFQKRFGFIHTPDSTPMLTAKQTKLEPRSASSKLIELNVKTYVTNLLVLYCIQQL